MQGYHRDFRNQRHKRRHRDYHENKCVDGYISDNDDSSEDRYDKGNHRIRYKNRGRNKDKYQSKNRYRNDSYDLGRGRSREKQCAYDARKITNGSKLELVNNIMQQLNPKKVMIIIFMKAVSEDVDDLFDNTCSAADVRCWLVKKYMYAKSQKAKNKNLTKDPHVNVNNASSQNLIQESVDTEFTKESNSDSNSEEGIQFLDLGECEIIDELDLWELEQIPHTIVTLTEGQVLEEFMLEEEIEFQDIDNVK